MLSDAQRKDLEETLTDIETHAGIIQSNVEAIHISADCGQYLLDTIQSLIYVLIDKEVITGKDLLDKMHHVKGQRIIEQMQEESE